MNSNQRLQQQIKEVFTKQKILIDDNERLYNDYLTTKLDLEEQKVKLKRSSDIHRSSSQGDGKGIKSCKQIQVEPIRKKSSKQLYYQ